MSEKQREALDKIMKAIPNLDDFEMGRLLGRAEAMESENIKKEKEKEKKEAE